MVNFINIWNFHLSVIFKPFIYQSICFFCNIGKQVNNRSNVFFFKYLLRYFPSQKCNKKITFPLLFSIICCQLTQYHQRAHLATLFFALELSKYFEFFLWHSHVLVFSFVFYLTISSPKSDPFSSHFSKPANFPRQTQRQKLLLFTQRAIVLEPAINPLKILPQKIKLRKNVLLFHPCLSPTPIWH